MLDMIEILTVPFFACLILAGILCYFGMHVIMREVIFVDLALAQIAAMGAAVGVLAGLDPHSYLNYACSLGFTFVGAALFALGRFRDGRVPQEAIIGIAYAVSTAVTILILSQIAIDQDEIEELLVGRLLLVDGSEVIKAGVICGCVGVLHLLLRRFFFSISTSREAAARSGINVRLWDFVFYVSFGLVVTSCVQIAGVLLVFSYLVVPAVCAMIFFRRVGSRLLFAWCLGLLASVGGLTASAVQDWPTGPAVVAMFGVVFGGCVLVYGITSRRFGRRMEAETTSQFASPSASTGPSTGAAASTGGSSSGN